MLGTLLDKLESLFSKRFVVGTIPLLAFLFLHGMMAYQVSHHLQGWVSGYFRLDATRVAVVSFALLLGVTILSYVFSTLSVPLREFLEGKYLSPLVFNVFSQGYRDRLTTIQRQLDEARRKRRVVRSGEESWKAALGDAYRAGRNVQTCVYVRRQELTVLFDRRAANQLVEPSDVEREVTALANTLRTNSPELDTAASRSLDADQGALLHLIRYAADKWEAEVVARLVEIQFDYAGEDVAATHMGNVSRVAPYYAGSRYSMNLEIVWTRLQKILQADASFYGVLQDAKLQVDFLVALVWLTMTFTATWAVVLPLLGQMEYIFLAIAILGPALTWVWYRIALQNYRAFSDLLRAAVDLYRLELLKALHVPLPANAEQERALWEVLERRWGYGERTNVALQHQ